MKGMEFVDDILVPDDQCDAHEERTNCTNKPVSLLDGGSWEMIFCVEHLKELRTAVLMEYLKRVTIPGAPQRRKTGGLA